MKFAPFEHMHQCPAWESAGDEAVGDPDSNLELGVVCVTRSDLMARNAVTTVTESLALLVIALSIFGARDVCRPPPYLASPCAK